MAAVAGHRGRRILERDLLQKRGVFVTLECGGHLRGCIGYSSPLFPLYLAVINCSISAATDDPRFEPLRVEELDQVQIEISVLSPMKGVTNIDDIEIGTHGLLISHKGKKGLLLPQVAVEHGWDRERFLSETCRKAGLRSDQWERGATLESFTAIVFRETGIPMESSVAEGGG